MGFNEDIEFDFFVQYPGFEPLSSVAAELRMCLDMVKIMLNQSLD